MNMLLRWQAYCTIDVLVSNCVPMRFIVAWVGVPAATIEFR